MDRQALWLPVAFACGIGLYFSLSEEPPLWLVPVLLPVLMTILIVFRQRQGVVLLFVFSLAMTAGFGLVQWRAHALEAPVLERKLPPRQITGTIAKLEYRKNGLRLTLKEITVASLEPEATPALVRLTSRFAQAELRPGDRVSIRGVLLPPPEAAMPDGFDFVRRAWFQQIGAVGYSLGKASVMEHSQRYDWRRSVGHIRLGVTQRILRAFPEDPVAGHLAAALMTGQRGGLPDEAVAAMRDAGLAHLLAISGLHIGLLASLVFFASRACLALVEPVALRYPIKKLAALAALAGAFVYLLMTGATVPTQRAFLMTALVLLAVMLDRKAISMGLVAWAAGVVLIISPESLTGPGFQMSFAAVIALIAVYERSQNRLSAWQRGRGPGRRVLLYILGVALTTVVASLATSPVAVAHFGRIATWGLAANLVAVPIMALWIMPWALAAFVLMPLGLEPWALAPMGVGINVMLEVARTVAAWPGAVQTLPAMPTHALAAMAMGGLWLCLWRPARSGIAGPLIGIGTILTGAWLWFIAEPPVVMIDGSGRLFGMVTQDDRFRVNNRRNSFTLRSWLAGQGLAEANPLVMKRKSRSTTPDSGELRCDSLGCLYQRYGQTVAIVNDLRALAEDCPVSSVVISSLPLRRNCPQPVVRIDRFDLWRFGAHALWIDDEGNMTVKSVAESRGQRLWSPQRQRPQKLQKRQRPQKLQKRQRPQKLQKRQRPQKLQKRQQEATRPKKPARHLANK